MCSHDCHFIFVYKLHIKLNVFSSADSHHRIPLYYVFVFGLAPSDAGGGSTVSRKSKSLKSLQDTRLL